MINLLTFCDIPWWLTWLLPFLLGLGLGYLLWGKYKAMVEDLENKINELNLKISGLEADLDACQKARLEVEGDLAISRGLLRECELKLSDAQSKKVSSATGIASAEASSLAAAAISKSDKWSAKISDNNLQIIEGIGPKMDEVLKENSVHNFNSLASKSPQELRDILDKYGDKYRIIDPATWPQQAALAADKKWDDLIKLQKELDTGRSDLVTTGETDSKLEKWLIKIGLIRKWKKDDLKMVEGIGPKIEELLLNEGIKTWKALADSSVERIQEILTAAGPRFSLADPGTWPQQAQLAEDGKWDELDALQDYLIAGRERK